MTGWTARIRGWMKMAITDRFKLYQPVRDDSFILAYGSNLLCERMAQRCPSMETVGTTVIPGYRMLFKYSRTGAYCTIEQDANCCVPAVVYRVSLDDEGYLDRCEGYPKYYYKREFFLPLWNIEGRKLRKRRNCIAYILHEDRMLGEPTEDYFRIVEQGYRDWGFDTAVLDKALSDSIGSKAADKWLKTYRKGNRNA